MKNAAMVGAIIVTAILLGGCPIPDQHDEPTPAGASGDPPLADDTDSGSTAPPLNGGPASGPADDTGQTAPTETNGDDTPDDTTVVDPPDEDTDEESTAPDVLPIPPGTYSGPVTVTEAAHCTGVYAVVAGAETYNVTEWPEYGVLIADDGLPILTDQMLDMGSIRIAYTSGQAETTADGVVATWLAQIEFIHPDTGEPYFSMPGTQKNVYRPTASGSLQIDFLLTADVADHLGTISYKVTMTGELSR